MPPGDIHLAQVPGRKLSREAGINAEQVFSRVARGMHEMRAAAQGRHSGRMNAPADYRNGLSQWHGWFGTLTNNAGIRLEG